MSDILLPHRLRRWGGMALCAMGMAITTAQSQAAPNDPFDQQMRTAETYQNTQALVADQMQVRERYYRAFWNNLSNSDKEKVARMIPRLARIAKQNPEGFHAYALASFAAYRLGQKELAIETAKQAISTSSTPNQTRLASWLLFTSQRGYEESALLKSKEAREILRGISQTLPTFAPYKSSTIQEGELPMACFHFSKPIEGVSQRDYQPYVQFEPAPQSPVFTVRNGSTELCVTGFKFGDQSKVTLRTGITALDGEKLAENVTFDIRLPDRTPFASFAASGHILPAHAPQFVPMEHVNLTETALAVVKIGERATAQLLRDGGFPDPTRRADEYMRDLGKVLFNGALRFNYQQNNVQRQGISLEDVLEEKLSTGLYLMLMGPADQYGNIENGVQLNAYNIRSYQWVMITNVGVSTLQGPDGLHAFVRTLANGEAMADTAVTLVAQNNEILGTATTNANGQATFAPALLKGKRGARPLYLYANHPEHGILVQPYRAPALDLSAFKTSGRSPAKNIDLYMTSERGMYRPGETAHVIALLRNQQGAAPETTRPLFLTVLRPDGLAYTMQKVAASPLSGYETTIDLPSTARHGAWRVEARFVPKGAIIGQTTLQVGSFEPPTVEMALETAESFLNNGNDQATVETKFLFGAPASDLLVEMVLNHVPRDATSEQWQEYHFGLVEEQVRERSYLSTQSTRTDANGKAIFDIAAQKIPSVPYPLAVEVDTIAYEPSGRRLSAKKTVPLQDGQTYIGLRPGFKNQEVPENSPATFEVVATDWQGTLQDVESANWVLYREEWDYTRYYDGQRWATRSSVQSLPVDRGTISLSAAAPSELSMPTQDGRYRLEVSHIKSGAISSYRFYAGWYAAPPEQNRPQTSEIIIASGKPLPGESIKAFIDPPFAGQAVLALAGSHLTTIPLGAIPNEGTTVDISIPESWEGSAGGYLVALVYKDRPTAQAVAHLPDRSVGISWIDLDTSHQRLEVSLNAATETRPQTSLPVSIEVAGLAPGETAEVLITAVDDGVLRLAKHGDLAPDAYLLAKTRFDYQMADSYGAFIDSYGLKAVQISQGYGSDELAVAFGPSGLLAGLTVRRREIVSLVSQIITVTGGAPLTHEIAVPDFSGRLKVQAAVWSKGATGHANQTVEVRETIVTDLYSPPFLAPQDRIDAQLLAVNTSDSPQSITLSATIEGPLDLLHPNGQSLATEPLTLTLQPKQQELVSMVLVGSTPGVGAIHLTTDIVTEQHTRRFPYQVRAPFTRVYERQAFVLRPGRETALSSFVSTPLDDNAQRRLTFSGPNVLKAASYVDQLWDYPWRCSEQSTSRGVGLLLGRDGLITDGKPVDQVDAEIKRMINRVENQQSYDGGYGYWGINDGQGLWLSSYVVDFLLMAKAEGYPVSEFGLNRALQSLARELKRFNPKHTAYLGAAYAHYVLAKAKVGNIGELRYFIDSHDNKLDGMSQVSLAAAANLYGDTGRRDRLLSQFGKNKPQEKRVRFGSTLRDMALAMALIAENDIESPALMQYLPNLIGLAHQRSYLSTQENAWLARLASALPQTPDGSSIDLSGTVLNASDVESVPIDLMELQTGVVKNVGTTPVIVTVEQAGHPTTAQPPVSAQASIKTVLLTLAGKPLDTSTIKSGDRFVVGFYGDNQSKFRQDFMAVHLLSSGLSIERKGVGDASMLELWGGWDGSAKCPKNARPTAIPAICKRETGQTVLRYTIADFEEAREDRYAAAIKVGSGKHFAVFYTVRAAASGQFVLPAPYIEAMYAPQIQARGTTSSIMIQ